MSVNRECKLEYYVLNDDFNRHKIYSFNIFDNIYVYDNTLKEVKKYIRSPNKYKYEKFNGNTYYGFEGFCKHLSDIIMYEEWSRAEYEIIVCSMFHDDVQEKIDCYAQAKPNIEVIAREVIYQYKKYKKESKLKDESCT